MIVDHEELMRWAKEQAPLGPLGIGGLRRSRPVRLEIGAESVKYNVMDDTFERGVVARVYLREPRCTPIHERWKNTAVSAACECGPLAEKRLA